MKKALLVLTLAVAAVYYGSLTGPYHFDDSHSVEGNHAIRSMANIPSFWTDAKTSSFIPENRVYRPLVYTFYSVCWWIGDGATWPFHLMKLLMQIAVALGMFAIWRRLWREPGWFPVKNLSLKIPLTSKVWPLDADGAALLLALFFAIHPAGAECAVYISATTSLQCAMFYVWAFVFYLRARDAGGSGRVKWSAAALGMYFLSVASKEEGVTLPAVILFTEWLLSKNEWKSRVVSALKTAFPYAAFGVVLAVWVVLMRPHEGHESRGSISSWEYFMTQWRAYIWYMKLWFWPWELNADNVAFAFSKSITEAPVIRALIANVLVLGLAFFNRARFPALWFGVVWFYVTISPASSVVVLAEAVNEHRMYLSYVGFAGGTFAWILWALERSLSPAHRGLKLGWLAALIVAGLTVGAKERVRVWSSSEALWLDTVEKNPTSGRAYNNLALVYMGRGDYQKAIEALENCERHWWGYMYCPLNKGISHIARGNKEEANTALHRAYNLNPKNTHTNYNLGRYYDEMEKDDEKALQYFSAADQVTGRRYPDAKARMAAIYIRQNRLNEARSLLQEALQIDPSNQGAWFEAGRIEHTQGRHAESMSVYRRLVEINPYHVQGWYNLGVSALSVGDLAAAREAFEKTVSLDPRSDQGWHNLAVTAERQGDVQRKREAEGRLAQLRTEQGGR